MDLYLIYILREEDISYDEGTASRTGRCLPDAGPLLKEDYNRRRWKAAAGLGDALAG
jgi:hypothetical protein